MTCRVICYGIEDIQCGFDRLKCLHSQVILICWGHLLACTIVPLPLLPIDRYVSCQRYVEQLEPLRHVMRSHLLLLL